VHKKVGHKFCLSGGIPNFMLAYESPDKVREFCKRIIREVAFDGGYIADASAIMANEASIENVRAMTETFREYGVY
jgi:uroporphyrinogen-III decarboxylase